MLGLAGLTKVFHPGEVNEVTAVDRVSLDVPQSQFVAIIGGNGSGKSTLLNLVAGTYLPDGGRIDLAGRDVTRVPEHGRAGLIGRVFQDPLMGTSAGLTVEENFALAACRGKSRGLGRALGRRLREEVREHLAGLGMGLEARLTAKVGLLSGGQRQAISILMAVFRSPTLLLLDEHTAALDPRASRKIMELTRTIVTQHRLTTLMITHNLAHALEGTHRVVVMSRGRIARDIQQEHVKSMKAEDLLALFWETQKTEDSGPHSSARLR